MGLSLGPGYLSSFPLPTSRSCSNFSGIKLLKIQSQPDEERECLPDFGE